MTKKTNLEKIKELTKKLSGKPRNCVIRVSNNQVIGLEFFDK